MNRTKGLVIKQSDYGEGNRMLTIFTEDFGIIKATVYGVKRAKSRQSAASQFLSWSEFQLYFGRGDVATVDSITPIESFFPIQEDLERLALCSYLTEITYYTQQQNIANLPLLRLLLNTIYACAYRSLSIKKAKAVFELRLLQDMGYMPVLGQCAACGQETEPAFFSCECGGVLCSGCHSETREDIPLSRAGYHALCYIFYAEEKKIFSFGITGEVLREIGWIAECSILHRMERKIPSLAYLKKVLTDG